MGVTLLIIMNTITILLCVLANQVTSQTNDIFPARILAQQKAISEDSDLYVTCSTFGFKKQIVVYVYLCKDDIWINKNMQKPDQNDTTFMIHSVGLHNSGNYSCVYSIWNNSLPKVAMRGDNVIQILVISNFLPADISVAGPSTISEGDHVAFRCTVSDTLQTLGKCQLIHSYLRRNETILQVQPFNVTRMEATFTIKSAVMRDSGHYSCVVLPSKCIREHEKTLYGNNAVLLEVTGEVNWVLPVFISCGVITLILSLGLSLWWINKRAGYSASSNPCAASQQANADMVEEQQVQTEGEDLDTQEGDSFSMEEEEEYQNTVAAEDFTYSDDCEGVYSVADEVDDEYDDIDQMCAK
ncbi:uncharacterized protein LOC116037602 isoform X2 [Sander lucioperca]|uniref:uncharacterized protein LOC116037602 isoform X2 n=1 Tax=Sander lucioperca TaxID=283035 RepID=UPI00125E1192|nr:uncharacterized protein LOC116037602 isoform X2 [Sander lucioperca]